MDQIDGNLNYKNNEWEKIGGLKQVDVSGDWPHEWDVNSVDYIYCRNRKNAVWNQFGCLEKWVSVSCDGEHMIGVNSTDNICYRNGKKGLCERIGGALKEIPIEENILSWSVLLVESDKTAMIVTICSDRWLF